MTKTPGRFSSHIALVALALATPASAQQCVGDIFADGQVNGADLGILLAQWGPASTNTVSDLDSNGSVDGADLGLLLSNWGRCTVPNWATLIEADPDPAVVTDPALRAAIAATGLAWRVRDTGTQIEMLLVPPGTFQMGCVIAPSPSGCAGGGLPTHQVTLTRSFYLGRFELTQAQWRAQMGSNPSVFQGYPDSENRPVEQVSWDAVQVFLSISGLRLPTEAEWEFACKAGTETPFYDGSTDENALDALGWFDLNACAGPSGCSTHQIGLKAANAFGFHDMLGNVGEWVSDWYFEFTPDAQVDPVQASGTAGNGRVYRGGQFWDPARYVCGSSRASWPQRYPSIALGVRVARDP